MAATVKSAAADTYEELKDQLAKAEATITSLRNEVASGLRQRKTGGGGTSAEDTSKGQLAQADRQTQQQARATEGVPVQIVAVLCLVSFLLAYFFF
jgi:type VI protein secretion system component VasF